MQAKADGKIVASGGVSRTLKVDYLARVEGEGGIFIRVKNSAVTDVKLRIFEPPRLFEAFLRGRGYQEVPDITARICGICPVAYQMSSAQAIENAFGIQVEGQLRALRRMLYCGEWIESHTLHIYMLHAPDFLGYPDVIQLAKDHPELAKSALELKKIGNQLMTIIGGREIHPVNVRVGGFYRVPTRAELAPMVEKLRRARDIALDTVRFTRTLEFPDFEPQYEYVALHHPVEYPITEGRLVSNTGIDIPIHEYEDHFAEEHVKHSNALHSRHKGGGAYLVGPMARFNLNFATLSPLAKEAAVDAGIDQGCHNPFKSIIVRAVETVYACDEALRLIENYEPPTKPCLKFEIQAGIGYGCTEAPRGILYHRYRIAQNGAILDAKIVPPTSQNQKQIEADLGNFVSHHLDLPEPQLTLRCEQVVRNYDPCISCATHALKLHIEKE